MPVISNCPHENRRPARHHFVMAGSQIGIVCLGRCGHLRNAVWGLGFQDAQLGEEYLHCAKEWRRPVHEGHESDP
jgi:hypothetical protein